jgi:hypothetical protein
LIGGQIKSRAWICELEGGQWVEKQKFTDPNGGLGSSVSLDGDFALIGNSSYTIDPFGIPISAGAARMYQFDGAQWNQIAFLTAPDLADGDGFGSAVAMSGGRILIGAPFDDDGGTDSGSVYAYDAFEESLLSILDSIPLAAGGTQPMLFRAGTEDAGALYLLATTSSGTCPGIHLGDVAVPSNFDPFTTYSVGHANQLPFLNTFGILDANGQAGMSIQLPAGLSPTLAGLELDHACIVIDPASFVVRSASNPVPLTLLP